MDPVVKIGKSIHVRGELSGNEDLTIEGTIEGKIVLKDHSLVVGSTGKIQAEIHAKAVTIQGEVHGNVHAEDRIELSTSGTVKGDLVAPRIVIADGARFKGTVDMDRQRQTGATAAARRTVAACPAPAPGRLPAQPAPEHRRPRPSSRRLDRSRPVKA
jgi:cytoskeletal protein CcmA (bactofilin family)